MIFPEQRRPVRRHSGKAENLRILARAKVNLTLEVLGRRSDGFHEIRSLMIPLALADRLTLIPGGRRLRIEVPNDPALESEDNLAFRAASRFRDAFGLPGLTIRLEKRIPVAAGLGGGSSDAAAVLRGLSRMRGVDPARLPPLAEALGSDVPFFLKEKPAVVRGRGEQLEPAPPLPPLWLLLVKPEFGISAADAYRARRNGGATRLRTRPAVWESARTASQVGKFLRNDLQPGCLALQPHLAELLLRLGRLRASGVLMSGSGSTCFAVFGNRPALLAAARRFEPAPGEAMILTRSLVSRSPRSLKSSRVVRPA
jgi:4-diphosphocytidyl-2-C-methyl-D-erythritol kinase